MNYQPNLYIFNIGDATAKSIYQVIKDLGFGRINHVEIENKCAYVAMDQWNMLGTTSTRMKLQQGKPLLLCYSEDNFWKVYSYENRYAEELHKKRTEKKKKVVELKRKAAILQKEKQEKQEKEYAIRKERKAKEEVLRREREIDEELEKLKMQSMEEQYDYHHYNIDDMKPIPVLDYGNAREVYPAIKKRAENMLNRLKNKK